MTWPPPKIDKSAPPIIDEDEDADVATTTSSIDSDGSDKKIGAKEEHVEQNGDANSIAPDSSDEFTDNPNAVDTAVETETEAETVDELEELDDVDIGITTVTTKEEEEDAKEPAVADTQATTLGEEENENDTTTPNLDEGMEVDTVVPDDEDEEKDDEEKGETQDQMRPEVLTAINCYCLTITHPMASPKIIEIALECIGLLISNRYVIGSTTVTTKLGENLDDSGRDEDFKKVSDVMRLINCICECADNASDAVQSAMSKDLLSLMTSPVCSVHEAGMLKAVRTVFHIYLITKHEDVRKMSREVLLDMLRSVFQRMEAYDAVAQVDCEGSLNGSFRLPKSPKNDEEEEGTNNIFASRFHTDSYLLFRALCKLSAKPLPEDADDNSFAGSSGGNLRVFTGSKTANSDPMATATKILSLELILCVFEHCGPAFRDGEKFIYAVQNFLCVSLLKNCVSSNTTVAHKSLKVFLLLVSQSAVETRFHFEACKS